MKLHTLKAPVPNRKTRKRLGRGEGSGLGQESGRGHNGQKSRSGYSYKQGFEGGQMPLQRRIPKFGFKNRFRISYKGVNLDTIQELVSNGKLGETITLADLQNAGLVSKSRVKILGRGELTSKISIEANAFSKSAIDSIEKAGGTTKTV